MFWVWHSCSKIKHGLHHSLALFPNCPLPVNFSHQLKAPIPVQSKPSKKFVMCQKKSNCFQTYVLNGFGTVEIAIAMSCPCFFFLKLHLLVNINKISSSNQWHWIDIHPIKHVKDSGFDITCLLIQGKGSNWHLFPNQYLLQKNKSKPIDCHCIELRFIPKESPMLKDRKNWISISISTA